MTHLHSDWNDLWRSRNDWPALKIRQSRGKGANTLSPENVRDAIHVVLLCTLINIEPNALFLSLPLSVSRFIYLSISRFSFYFLDSFISFSFSHGYR